MSEKIQYEEFGEISDKMPLESLYEAMLPILKNYGLTAEFPADKPSLDYSINGIEFDVLIGELPNAIRYMKWQESPYANGGLELLLESKTLVHGETGEKLSLKIFITDYISGMTHPTGTLWLTVNFRGEKSEVEALKNVVAPVLAEYKFHSRKNSNSTVSIETNDNSSADFIKNTHSNFMTNNNVNFDELARKSFAPEATSDDYEKLFASVFSLLEWYFVADGEFAYKMPYCAMFPDYFGDEIALTVFTDGERARKFIAEKGIKPKPEDAGNPSAPQTPEDLILRISTTGILDFFEKLKPLSVTKIFFNPNKDSHGFHHDLKMMRPIYEHLKSKGLLSENEENSVETEAVSAPIEEKVNQPANDVDFDSLSKIANGSDGSMDDLNELFGEAFALEKWDFIARGEIPNINPYVAARADVADGQQMIRAFTDGARLQRFAKENNLTREDGSVDVLSVPTKGIVEYLEQFMDFGVHGVWFNSDVESDGFFIPLKQLQPIKDHLAKINWQKKNAPKQSIETLQFVVKEGLMLPSGEIKPASYTSNIFWRAPSSWIENGKIKAEHLRKFEQEMSGGKSEEIEGAFYTAIDYSTKLFTPEEAKSTDWRGMSENSGESNTFFIASENDAVRMVSAEEFQKDVDSSFQTNEKSNQSPSTVEEGFTTLLLTITDGLMLPSGSVSKSSYNCNFFCWIPRDWTENLQLKPEYLEKLYAQFYGASWRSGNSDGSRYVVIESNSAVISPERVQATKWNIVQNSDVNRYWFYIGDAVNGTFKNVTSDEFQTHFDSYFQTQKHDEERKRQDNLANWGMSETPDGDFDLNLTINKVGAVNFDTSIAPFYEAIVPLLKDFQGTGDYVTLLRFEESGKSDEVENIAENSHGAYLQIRRFVYLNPKNGVRIGVNSIHSSYLRHVHSNAELLVSIELCKNLDNQTGVFYHAFQGPKSDVLNLVAAIQPILESVNYQAVQ